FAFAVLLGWPGGGVACLWPIEHGSSRLLCHSGRTRRGFRNPDIWAIPTGANRRRTISTRDWNGGRKARPGSFLRRAHDCGWFSRTHSQRLDGFCAAGRPDRDRDFLCRAVHVHNPILVRSAAAVPPAPRLGVRGGEKICALECAKARSNA